jgi:hypothetical protein
MQATKCATSCSVPYLVDVHVQVPACARAQAPVHEHVHVPVHVGMCLPPLTLLILRSPSTILGSSLGCSGSVAIFTTLQQQQRQQQQHSRHHITHSTPLLSTVRDTCQ